MGTIFLSLVVMAVTILMCALSLFTLYDCITSLSSSPNLLKMEIQKQISNILRCLLTLAELRFSSWPLVLYQKKKSKEIAFNFENISSSKREIEDDLSI